MARTSIPAPASAAWRHTVALLDRLFPPPRSFAIRLWDGTALPASLGSAPFTLALNHPGALRRMFAPPLELSLGEAYNSPAPSCTYRNDVRLARLYKRADHQQSLSCGSGSTQRDR